jgi:SAM-dependent methyltransferase
MTLSSNKSMSDGEANVLDPQAPHDDLSFEELSSRYNFALTSDRRRVLVRLLIKESQKRPRPVRALDIGCGTGISEQEGENVKYLRGVRDHVDELWGIEPDVNILPHHGLLDHFQHAVMETANLPADGFDVAYSYFVMEHVNEPEQFLRAVYRCLKPGGVYVFMTPNANHYFTRMARFLKAIRLDELVLRLVRGKVVDQYHYPVYYKCNGVAAIRRFAARVGFQSADFAFIERSGPVVYFPRPLRPIAHLLDMKRKVIHSPGSLLEMICRLTKPA